MDKAIEMLNEIINNKPKTFVIFYWNEEGMFEVMSGIDSNYYDPICLIGYMDMYLNVLKDITTDSIKKEMQSDIDIMDTIKKKFTN